METVTILLSIWGFFAVPAGIVTGLIAFFGRRRVDWTVWEALVFVIPFLIWSGLMASDLSANQKSLANLGEPIYFMASIPIVALLRVMVGRRIHQQAFGGALIALVSAIAVATFFLVPPLPET